jgi:hypothetical protein
MTDPTPNQPSAESPTPTQSPGPTTENPSKPIQQNKNLKKWLIKSLKLVIILVVLASVVRQIARSWNRLPEFQPNLPLLAVSGLLYIAGLAVFGLYYARIVRLVAPSVSTIESLRAYVLSHPAKYVPGKGMVVVIRVGLLARSGARGTAAMLSALYETLSMMAIGGLLGAALLAIPPAHLPAALLSSGLGVAFAATVLPMTFSRAARLLKKGLSTIEPGDAPTPGRSDWPALLVYGSIGWLCWGLSMVAVVSSLDTGQVFDVSHWPRTAGAMMLATVGGFALPILPGGLGLREWILDEVTGGLLGPDLAIASALVVRFVWIIEEIVAAAAISLIPSKACSNQPVSEPEVV